MHPYPKHRKFLNQNLSVWLKCMTITCTFCSHLRLPLFVPCVSNLLSQYYTSTCQNSAWSHALGVSRVSRLRVENSISRRLTLEGQFLTPDWKMWVVAVLLNSDPCKERKPCVKWINDSDTLLVISSFPDNFAFGRLRTSSEAFGCLRTSSGIFGNNRVIFKIPSTPRIKISRLYLRKSCRV